MSTLVNLLWLVLVNVMVEYRVDSFLFNGHANVSGSPPDNGYYNIYSKIDYLERALQNLETIVQQKETHMDTLLRQVLLTVNEMDAKIESSGSQKIESNTLRLKNMSLEIEQLKALTKNDTAVGFTTTLSGSYSSTSSIIRGYTLLYNGGNAYNGTVFTCPSPGLYLFQVSLITTTKTAGIWIYKNSQQLTLAYTSNAQASYNGGAASVVIWLDAEDQVYLRPYSSSLQVDPDSVFTGVKVT